MLKQEAGTDPPCPCKCAEHLLYSCESYHSGINICVGCIWVTTSWVVPDRIMKLHKNLITHTLLSCHIKSTREKWSVIQMDVQNPETVQDHDGIKYEWNVDKRNYWWLCNCYHEYLLLFRTRSQEGGSSLTQEQKSASSPPPDWINIPNSKIPHLWQPKAAQS